MTPETVQDFYEVGLCAPNSIRVEFWVYRPSSNHAWGLDACLGSLNQLADLSVVRNVLRSKVVREKLTEDWTYKVFRTTRKIVDRSKSPLEQLAECAE